MPRVDTKELIHRTLVRFQTGGVRYVTRADWTGILGNTIEREGEFELFRDTEGSRYYEHTDGFTPGSPLPEEEYVNVIVLAAELHPLPRDEWMPDLKELVLDCAVIEIQPPDRVQEPGKVFEPGPLTHPTFPYYTRDGRLVYFMWRRYADTDPKAWSLVRERHDVVAMIDGKRVPELDFEWDRLLPFPHYRAIASELPFERTDSTRANQADDATDPARHSVDFRSVHWFGTHYTFTAMQAAVVGMLWQASAQDTTDVGDVQLLKVAGSDQRRLVNMFKVKGKSHPAWGVMIVHGNTKASRRLKESVRFGKTLPKTPL